MWIPYKYLIFEKETNHLVGCVENDNEDVTKEINKSNRYYIVESSQIDGPTVRKSEHRFK